MAVYGRTTRWLHGVNALLIISLLIVGFWMTSLPRSELKWLIYGLHKSFGLTVLALMLFRLGWRLKEPWLALPQTMPSWQRILARLVHVALYVVGIVMPLSGWVMSVAARHDPKYFGLFVATLPIEPSRQLAGLAHDLHGWLAWLIIGLVLLHTSAALCHGLGSEGIIWRMWQKKRP